MSEQQDNEQLEKERLEAAATAIALGVGRFVHFVIRSGECRAAVVVRFWADAPDSDMVNLYVFMDGGNDAPESVSGLGLLGIEWRTSVHYDGSAEPKPGTWHWYTDHA